MAKWLLFQLHWLLGLSAGIVLAVVGVTGGMLSFERELVAALNPGVVTVARRDAEPLAPSALLSRLVAANPQRHITSLDVPFGTDRTPRVAFAVPNGRPEWRYVDPYSAELLGTPRGEAFFRTTRELHRYLVAGDVGKHIVGASTVALLVLAMTGLYLRWPRNVRSWRAWTQIDFRLSGRAFLYRLHAVVGTWVLTLYLLAALTGLTWSYEWYRSGFFAALGAPAPQRPGGPPQAGANGPAPSLDAIWPAFASAAGPIESATFVFPNASNAAVEIRYLGLDAPHERAVNHLVIDPGAGVTLHERYAEKALGARLAGSVFPLHRGSYFGVAGTVVMMVASLAMPLFAVTGLMMYLQRRKRREEADAAPTRPGRVAAVSSSPTHTMTKPTQQTIRLVKDRGVEGDAHNGELVKHRSRVARDPSQPNLRQVHLLHAELHDVLAAAGFTVAPGQMGENVTTRGIDLLALPTGTHLRLGDTALVRVTGLRNPCTQLDGLQRGLMAATLARDATGAIVRKAGVMAVVVASGEVRPNDVVSVELPPLPHEPLQPV